MSKQNRSTVLFEPPLEAIQSAPLCPWREPAEDLKSIFPSATRYEAETHILSGRRTELASLLGRLPTGDENALHVYRIYDQQNPVGVILTQRVKGAYGAIELVLGVDPDGKVNGIRLQRHREPEAVARVLLQSSWLAAFVAKEARDPWKLGQDIPGVPEEARVSANAIVKGAQSMLILLQEANKSGANSIVKPHH
ncbi:MAG TPA: hypothetical protein VL361_04405 [Candidatus Limnocylindrales bacterium]|jgi:hypothetical protein|nr:hypothetical protein [Candidatus Limnocylindrales bacterium]